MVSALWISMASDEIIELIIVLNLFVYVALLMHAYLGVKLGHVECSTGLDTLFKFFGNFSSSFLLKKMLRWALYMLQSKNDGLLRWWGYPSLWIFGYSSLEGYSIYAGVRRQR